MSGGGLMAELTDTQHQYLIRPLKASRVEKTQGMSYLEAFDVIAHLTRVFGWEGWDKELLQLDVVFEDHSQKRNADGTGGKAQWTVCYRCSMRLTIRNPDGALVKVVEDVGTGEAINQPSRGDAHDLASKSAVSGALKRCAKDLGDQFGLGLYDKGSLDPTVRTVIAYDPPVTLQDSSDQGSASPAPAISPEDGPPASSDRAHADQGDPPAPDPEAPESLVERAERLGSGNAMTTAQKRKIFTLLGKFKIEDRHAFATQVLHRPIDSFSDLTKVDAHKLLEDLTRREEWQPQEGEEMFGA
jgi:Rad52/22 family double-strand break repair protein